MIAGKEVNHVGLCLFANNNVINHAEKYDFGNNHILAQKNGKSRKYTVLKHILQ